MRQGGNRNTGQVVIVVVQGKSSSHSAQGTGGGSGKKRSDLSYSFKTEPTGLVNKFNIERERKRNPN